jgi:hypothetical protein
MYIYIYVHASCLVFAYMYLMSIFFSEISYMRPSFVRAISDMNCNAFVHAGSVAPGEVRQGKLRLPVCG